MRIKLLKKEYVDSRKAIISTNLPLTIDTQTYTNVLFNGAKLIKVYVYANNSYLDVFEFAVGLNAYTTKEHTLVYSATNNSISYSTISWQVSNRSPAIRRIIVEY